MNPAMNEKEHFRTAVYPTPFHERTSAANKLNVWHRWKDYTVSDAYFNTALEYAAIRNAAPSQIEAIDMGRRALHNDGAEILTKSLTGKFAVDFETSRRLFTLICALHARG